MKTEQAKTYTKEEVDEIVAQAIGQDREFICQTLRSLPRQMDADVKQGWIENPAALQTSLACLNPPKESINASAAPILQPETAPSTIVRRVTNIRRNRTAQQAINATGRVQYIDKKVVDSMPVGQGPEEVELHYFCLNRQVSDDELAREFTARGLAPDPQAQAADNEADPEFADKHPNGTHWKVGKEWHYIAFRRFVGGERCVGVHRSVGGWDDNWWFAGVRNFLCTDSSL